MKKTNKDLLFSLATNISTSKLIAAGWTDKDFQEWNEIPIIKNLYTILLSDIKNKKRIHKQSTFGDIKEFNPENNICNSPMCTAGHIVNMAGKIGYNLRHKYGWHTAAYLIHKKAHPDHPAQNYNNIPQEWAMAYIEKMAEIESENK